MRHLECICSTGGGFIRNVPKELKPMGHRHEVEECLMDGHLTVLGEAQGETVKKKKKRPVE